MRGYGIVLVFACCLCACQPTLNKPGPAPFDLTVVPDGYLATVGKDCIMMLVSAADKAASAIGSGPVTISATCPGADVVVYHPRVKAGEVAEISVIPTGEVVGELEPAGAFTPPSYHITVTVTGQRAGLTSSVTRVYDVYDGMDWNGSLNETAQEMRDFFVSWLIAHQPELGITAATRWTYYPITCIGPQRHTYQYLFFSDQWEMAIDYFFVATPYDPLTVALRRRFTSDTYSDAFQIPSWTSDPRAEPAACDPPGLMR
jgi:hypothetical protein